MEIWLFPDNRNAEMELQQMGRMFREMNREKRVPTEEELRIIHKKIQYLKEYMDWVQKEMMNFLPYKKIVKESSKNPPNNN